MSPTASSAPLHVVMDGGSPVWLQPLLTGAFVLAAALIALTSLWLSDRRKLAREDRRQWDRELKQSYVVIAAEVQRVRLHLSRVRPGDDESLTSVLEALEASMTVVSQNTESMRLFAPKDVVEAAYAVGASLATIWQKGFVESGEDEPDVSWAMKDFVTVDPPVERLRDTVRKALRV